MTLRVTRDAFKAQQVTTSLGWNKYVVLPTITLQLTARSRRGVDTNNASASHCEQGRLPTPVPMVLVSNVRAWTDAECSDRGSIVPEIQAVREQVNLPTSGVSLVYLSSRAVGYKSVMKLQLVPAVKPANLLRVHIRVVVEGKLDVRKLEAMPGLTYTFEWDRTDAYAQKSYGVVPAEGGKFCLRMKIYKKKQHF